MSPSWNARIGPVLFPVFLGLTLTCISPARADDHTLIEKAHYELEQALNTGGPTPSDADRTAHLNAAFDDLQLLPPHFHGHRMAAMAYIKSALYEMNNENSSHSVDGDIRDADSEVRNIE